MQYTFYDKETGNILFTLASHTKPADGNGFYVQGAFDPNEYRIVNGEAVKKSIKEVEADQISIAWVKFRNLRNAMLKDCDWTQVPDAPVDQAAWASYRQELRDLPSKTEDPRNPAWPTPPA